MVLHDVAQLKVLRRSMKRRTKIERAILLKLNCLQILANFNKAIVKIHGYFQGIREKAAESTLAIGDKSAPEKLQALDIELADEENELERGNFRGLHTTAACSCSSCSAVQIQRRNWNIVKNSF